MRPRILFVVMSAVAPVATVDQLARSLAPHHVLVHHDFSQTPEFPLQAQNVSFVPEPVRTGWATFGFVDGIFHSLAQAVEHLDFDYLQLLSPTCLPIKPMALFDRHVAEPVDAHFGAIDLLADDECLLNVGYRATTAHDSFGHRVLRRLTGESLRGATQRRHEAGIWLRSGDPPDARARLARAALRAGTLHALRRTPFGDGLRPYYGSVWFGARRPIVRGMVEAFRDPGVRSHFSGLRISEEFLVPSLLMKLAPRHGALNHFISRFDEAHPTRLDMSDLQELRASPAFFARKFSDQVEDALRNRVLEELAGVPPDVPSLETGVVGPRRPGSAADQPRPRRCEPAVAGVQPLSRPAA